MTTSDEPPVSDEARLENGSVRPSSAASAPLRRIGIVMACGIFVSTFSQVGVIGLYPFRFFLKEHLGMGATLVSLFIEVANIPWNLKVFAGVVADGVPIFGTRRRHYLILSCAAASVLWLAVGVVPPKYVPLLVMATSMNIALVFVSTVSGGLLVEAGQRYGATGRLSAFRVVAMNLALLGTSAGAFLAARGLGLSTIVAAAPLILMLVLTFFLLKEPPVARRDPRVLMGMWTQLKACFHSRMLWVAAALLFLVQFAPGFLTPLMYYQTDTLGFSKNQIGVINLVDAAAGTAGALAYGYFCRRWSLKTLLYWSIVVTAAVSMLYLWYNGWKSALVIEAVYSFAWYLAQLPLYDLAARATPKGSEALGYSIIVSAWNWGLFVSDIAGSWMYEHKGIPFKHLVWINAATTALVLIAVPFLPKRLVDVKEGDPTVG